MKKTELKQIIREVLATNSDHILHWSKSPSFSGGFISQYEGSHFHIFYEKNKTGAYFKTFIDNNNTGWKFWTQINPEVQVNISNDKDHPRFTSDADAILSSSVDGKLWPNDSNIIISRFEELLIDAGYLKKEISNDKKNLKWSRLDYKTYIAKYANFVFKLYLEEMDVHRPEYLSWNLYIRRKNEIEYHQVASFWTTGLRQDDRSLFKSVDGKVWKNLDKIFVRSEQILIDHGFIDE